MAERFEYDEIKSKLVLLKQYCTDYVKAVVKIETTLQTELNVSTNSALFGVQGSKVNTLWENYCAKLPNFLYVFEKWMDNVSEVYNNNMLFEAGNDQHKLEIDSDTNLSMNSGALSDTEKERLSNLFSGNVSSSDTEVNNGVETITIGGVVYQIIRDENDNIIKIIDTSSGQETDLYASSFEDYINSMYHRYLDGELTEEEWNTFKNSLNNEQRQYAIYLDTGATIDNFNNVESILYGTNGYSMAEEVALNNTPPSDGFVDDEVSSRTARIMQLQDTYRDWFSTFPPGHYDGSLGVYVFDPSSADSYYNRLYLNWNGTDEESNVYIEREIIPDDNGQVTADYTRQYSSNQCIYTLYVDGVAVATYESNLGDNLSFNQMKDLFNQAFPTVYETTYSAEGEAAYSAFSSNVNANYDEFCETGIFYFNNDRTIYYDSSNGQIHYPDGSILDTYSNDLAWIRFWFINIKDKSAIKSIFMIANGYIEYSPLE